MNPAEWLRRTARRHPERPALFRGTTCLGSYADFARAAACIGAGLAAQGGAPGDRVALFLANSPAYAAKILGVVYAEGRLRPRDPDLARHWFQRPLKEGFPHIEDMLNAL